MVNRIFDALHAVKVLAAMGFGLLYGAVWDGGDWFRARFNIHQDRLPLR